MFGILAGLLSVGTIVVIFLQGLNATNLHAHAAPVTEGDTYALGKLLFTQYTLPFEIVSVLLLVAMIGVILLSKKKLE